LEFHVTEIETPRCVREELLGYAVEMGGVAQVVVQTSEDLQGYVVQVNIAKTGDVLMLATQRKPKEPRVFKTIEASISAVHRLIGPRPVIVDVNDLSALDKTAEKHQTRRLELQESLFDLQDTNRG
jgi:hypothetical protein